MANQNKHLDARAVVRTKVETTYEHVPIVGAILGVWRVQRTDRIGEDIELHLDTPLTEYDRVFINGKEIKLGLSTI